MKTVVKLGGVNGSGKTTVARGILGLLNNLETYDVVLPSGKLTYFHVGIFGESLVTVLGKYEAACGGMDTISDKHDRFWAVEFALNKFKPSPDIIFFEGLITGKTYGALGELSDKTTMANKARWLYTFMDTPFDVAADRVLQRRAQAGNHAPFDPERTMRSTYTSCQRLEQYLRGEADSARVQILSDHHVLSLKHTQRPKTLAKKVLNKALEIRHAG